MITRVEGGLTYNQTFDAENRLISVTVSPSGQTTQFIYDGDGNLVKKVNPDNSKTIYVLGIYEVDKTSGGTVTQTRTYYPAAGAMRIGSTLYYVLKDHLGSASVITNASGATVSGGEQRYYPFGESRLTATMLTDKLFTGQREMAGLGIYHYGARFYSPKLGRFLSADTIVQNAANPQAFNRFSYVVNNPIRYNDPTGHVCSDPDDPSPSCESGNPYPNNTQPLGDDPVVINNPGPLDEGQEQGDPTPSPDPVPEEGSPACPTCILLGVAIFAAMLLIEIPLGVGFVVALQPPLLPLEILIVPLELAALNITFIGIEYIAQGQENTLEEIDIDPLPLLHLGNPDLWH